MKKFFNFFWQLTKKIYAKINACEENFMRKFDDGYTSKLAKNSLIYLAVNVVAPSLLLAIIMGIFAATDTRFSQPVGVLIAIISYLIPLILFVTFYVRKRLPLIQGRKWWYVIQITLGFLFGGYIIILPISCVIGVTILLGIIAFYILIALAVLWVVFTMILGGSSGGSKRRRWKLDNGDVVTEEKGILGESYYTGQGGTSYDTDDGVDTFYKK